MKNNFNLEVEHSSSKGRVTLSTELMETPNTK